MYCSGRDGLHEARGHMFESYKFFDVVVTYIFSNCQSSCICLVTTFFVFIKSKQCELERRKHWSTKRPGVTRTRRKASSKQGLC